MPGHKLSKPVRMKLRAGQSVRLVRGWKRPAEPERPPSSCRRISPETGQLVGLFEPHRVEPPAAQLRLKRGWRRKRIMVRRTSC